jgi:hypothetical protein
MSPAEYIIDLFGSRAEVGRICGVSPSAVTLWTRPRKRGGCGGDIPSMRHVRKLLAAAEKRGLDLTERDLVHGREPAVA